MDFSQFYKSFCLVDILERPFVFCGALIIKCMSAKKNYNPEEVKLLIHILLSHHGKGEYDAAVAPAIPEAFAVHHIDNMDAKITQCEKIYEEIGGGTITEKRPFAFDNRLYNAKWYALLIISILSIVYGLTTVKFFAFLESAGAEKSANMSISARCSLCRSRYLSEL